VCRLPANYFPGLEVENNLAPDMFLSRMYLMGEVLTSLTTTLLQGNFYVFAGSNQAVCSVLVAIIQLILKLICYKILETFYKKIVGEIHRAERLLCCTLFFLLPYSLIKY